MFEQGGMSHIAGVMPRTIPTQTNGTLPLQAVENAIRAYDVTCHLPITELICRNLNALTVILSSATWMNIMTILVCGTPVNLFL